MHSFVVWEIETAFWSNIEKPQRSCQSLIFAFCVSLFITCIFKTITKSLGTCNQSYASVAYETSIRFSIYTDTAISKYTDPHFVL